MTYVKFVYADAVVITKVYGSLDDPYVYVFGTTLHLNTYGIKYEAVPKPKELMPEEPTTIGKVVVATIMFHGNEVAMPFMRIDNPDTPWMSYYNGAAIYRKWESMEHQIW